MILIPICNVQKIIQNIENKLGDPYVDVVAPRDFTVSQFYKRMINITEVLSVCELIIKHINVSN